MPGTTARLLALNCQVNCVHRIKPGIVNYGKRNAGPFYSSLSLTDLENPIKSGTNNCCLKNSPCVLVLLVLLLSVLSEMAFVVVAVSFCVVLNEKVQSDCGN